ncbi:hypothetical protein LTR09_008646 [Extremus antarcticus]|uniref:DUF7223 domain-containing protein n=1 Tax=Extremus antarcticus TaxID=702011 RepID=A0AAJ0DGQ5_9PEZI|nr:hypothetical protein LTR09_008646 [Extremus antarcticus]
MYVPSFMLLKTSAKRSSHRRQTTNKVTLTAKPKTWEDAFDHWQLKISSKGITPQSAHSSRSLVKRIGYNGTQSLSLDANFATDPIELTSSDDSDATASIGCDPCYTTGSLDFDIDVTYWFPAQISGSVTMTPNNIGATFVANVEASEELTSQHSASKELFALHPDGINIDRPEFTINLAAGINSLDAKMDVFSSGISMSIPAEAIAVLDFDDSSLNQFQDWSPVFAPAMPENFLSAEISLSAFAGIRTRIEFDIELFNYGFLAGFSLDAPSFGVTLTGQAADGGVCDDPEADFGVDLSMDLFAELDFFIGVGGDDDEPNKQNIFSTGVPIFTTCMVVASGAPAPSAAPSAQPSAAPGNVSAPAYPSGSAAPSGSNAASSSQPAPASSSSAVISYAPQPSSAPAGSSTAVVVSSSPQSSSAPAAVSSVVIVYVSSVAAAPSAASSGW